VLDNLLGNAIKYSPAGGEVVIQVSREAEGETTWAVLRVRDQGVGIPAADLPHVFERYWRGQNVQGRIVGTGIGLTGARQVVEQQGGRVEVRSQVDVGTMVTVRLPVLSTGIATLVA
jgi:signal transduction histidine kinase